MSTAIAITLGNGEATPVNHTFEVGRKSSDFTQYEDRVNGIYVGYNRLTFQLTRPKGASADGNRNLKYLIKIETPILEEAAAGGATGSGYTNAPRVAYRPVFEGKFTLPERASLAEKEDIVAFAKNIFAKSQVTDMLEANDFPS